MLVEGFVRNDVPEIQAAYLESVPVSPLLADLLDGPYRDLESRRADLRLKAVSEINGQIRRRSSSDGTWMRDPRASGPLTERLSDSDDDVAMQALFTMRRLVWGHFPDQRARQPLTEHLASARQRWRSTAISAVGWLRHEQAIEPLAPLLAEGTDEDRAVAAAQLYVLFIEDGELAGQIPLSLSHEGRARWEERLRTAADDPSGEVRSSASFAAVALSARKR